MIYDILYKYRMFVKKKEGVFLWDTSWIEALRSSLWHSTMDTKEPKNTDTEELKIPCEAQNFLKQEKTLLR